MQTTRSRKSFQALVRPRVALVTVAALAAATAVLLSDRAPGVLGEARARYDAPSWFPWALDNATLHFFLWMGVTLLAVLAVRSLAARLVVGAAVLTASVASEYLQVYLSFTRRFETADIVANGRGVMLGLAIGLIVGAAVDGVERRRRFGAGA